MPGGSSVTATLSKAQVSEVTIPLTLTAGTAESGDYGALTNITINSGATAGTGTITTNQDVDPNNETFTAAPWSLSAPLTAGSPSSVEVTIADPGALNVMLQATLRDPAPAGGVTVTFFANGAGGSPGEAGVDYTLAPAHPSDSASPAIAVYHGTIIWVAVISKDQNAYKEYSVYVTAAHASIEVYSPVDVEHETVPESFAVHGNYPNPFRRSTRIVVELPWPARAFRAAGRPGCRMGPGH